jgi:hypothetical protein
MPATLLAMTFPTQRIHRVPVSSFLPNLHYFHPTHETPVIVENFLTRNECETVSETIVRAAYHNPVQVQRQTRKSKASKITTHLYETIFGEAVDWMMTSHHGNATFCFCEGLLDSFDSNSDVDESTMDSLRQTIRNVQKLFAETDQDLFSFFPNDLRPTDCVILAGEGATSTLHRDPFEWTGTSLCLEGTKLWRFIAPPVATISQLLLHDSGVEHVDRAMNSYRLTSVAWGSADHEDNPKPISSGWQSDLSLYASIHPKMFPSALQLAHLEEQNLMKEKNDALEQIVGNFDTLTPNIPKIFGQDDPKNSKGSNDSFKTVIWTAVQKPGDLLLIPAHWWHQTYALEPSLAVASQRCGLHRDAHRVVNHIFETRGLDLHTFMREYDIHSATEFSLRLQQDPASVCTNIFNFIR